MIIVDILYDIFFAAIAGIGFGAISDPPLKSFPSIAILSALGHGARFCFMHYAGMDIASASLIGAFIIGMGSFIAGGIIRCPMTVLSIPSLLPMVPGIFAYKTILSLIMFLGSSAHLESGVNHLQMFWSNFLVAFTTTFNLAIGAILPHFIFREKALSLTREHQHKEKSLFDKVKF
jgi:uncharacterized membrane protein YjjB (DUF3815 family)